MALGFTAVRRWAAALKRDVMALWLAARDPRVAWYAKALAGSVAAYALSPIDLIPDFIPVLGYLDDLILLPLGIAAVVRLIPVPLMADLRHRADELIARPGSRISAGVIVVIWLTAAASLAALSWPALSD